MSLNVVQRIANAVLYEGYILYPYRPSAVKNQRRFNFGVLVPPAYSAAQRGTETCVMRTECLVLGGGTRLDVRLRFLQVIAGCAPEEWQRAQEREAILTDCGVEELAAQPRREHFGFPVEGAAVCVEGTVTATSRPLAEGLYLVAVHVVNRTPLECREEISREEILPYSLTSAHTILEARDGEFVSLLDPPAHLRAAAAECQNMGTWPVLAGERGQRTTMLSSPIILYDYPEIAPESPGDLCDGTEIDEILTLRILTLTDEEKQEVRNGDERARRILERTEALPQEHFMKLHGALRGLRPVEESK